MATNCYLIWDRHSRQAFVIDPGAPSEELETFISRERLQVLAIFNTHGHADHIGGNYRLQAVTNARLLLHKDDQNLLQDENLNLSAQFGFPILSPPADELVEDGQQFKLGHHWVEICHTPGHTPGSICMITEQFLFSGDTLFADAIGRTDFPGGNRMCLNTSLKEKILPLDPRLQVLPGHGSKTTLAREKQSNPFLLQLIAG